MLHFLPQTKRAVICTITGSLTVWYSLPSDNNVIAIVSFGQVSNVANTGFTAALVSVNNSGLTTNLSFNALLIRMEHKSGVVMY